MPSNKLGVMGASGSSGAAGFTLYAWGKNTYGQLGNGSTAASTTPVQIGESGEWSNILGAGYAHSHGIKEDYTLWSWGLNHVGQLGLGNTTYYSSPVQVGTAYWQQVAGSKKTVAAIKTDGTLWTWGYHNSGSLGTGVAGNVSTPVQVGALTDWSKVYGHSNTHAFHALKTDGTLWGWGINSHGLIGDGSAVARSSPVQIGALTTWWAVGAGEGTTHAIKTDGTLWGWGRGLYGALGDGTTVNKSSPVQIGALTTWADIASWSRGSAAIDTSGKLWTWGGGNFNGTLGQGDYNIRRSSPTQVGALTDWAGLGAPMFSTWLATKTNGALWGCGTGGPLGQSLYAELCSPIQIGALTNWQSGMAMGTFHAVAVR